MRSAKCAGTQTSNEWPYCSFLYCGQGLKSVPRYSIDHEERWITYAEQGLSLLARFMLETDDPSGRTWARQI